jgi:hypothetical protein
MSLAESLVLEPSSPIGSSLSVAFDLGLLSGLHSGQPKPLVVAVRPMSNLDGFAYTIVP